MDHQPLVNSDKVSRVKLSTGERHIQLALRLSHEFTGGDLVRFASGRTGSIEGIDELSATHNRSTWACGIASGALYAFRSLRVPRQCVVVAELAGRLLAGDMDAVANGAAIAVAKLVGKELPSLPTEGWTVHSELTEQEGSVFNQKTSWPSNRSGTVSLERMEELRSLSSAELLLLVQSDTIERGLSLGELRLIHDIAAERIEAGDEEANTIRSEVGSSVS